MAKLREIRNISFQNFTVWSVKRVCVINDNYNIAAAVDLGTKYLTTRNDEWQNFLVLFNILLLYYKHNHDENEDYELGFYKRFRLMYFNIN